MPNFAFSGERKQATTKFYFLFELGYFYSDSGRFAYIWQSRWVGLIAIKTERTQIHFLSDVIVAVASLDLKVHIRELKQWRQRQRHVFWRTGTQRFCFSFPELQCSPLEFNSKKIRQHLRYWTRWNNAIKFKVAQIHFLSDAFVIILGVGSFSRKYSERAYSQAVNAKDYRTFTWRKYGILLSSSRDA